MFVLVQVSTGKIVAYYTNADAAIAAKFKKLVYRDYAVRELKEK